MLIVDDETLVRAFVADQLDEAGLKVFQAVNAEEALVILEARSDIEVVLALMVMA